MSQPIIVAGRLVIEDKTKKGMDSAKKGITGTLKSIAKSAAGFLARDVVNSLVGVGRESIQLGAKIETLRTSFEAMRDPVLDSELTLENLRAATQDTISDIDLLTAANNAMALGLPTNELDDMFAAAQRVGAAMGRTTLEAVQDLTTGIGRQSKMILDNLGILVDTNLAYETFADNVGKSAEELTDAEKKTAFMNAAIDSLTEKAAALGDNLSTTQLAQEQFSASIENIKTSIGEALIPALADALTAFSDIIDIVKDVVTAIKEGDWERATQTIVDAFGELGSRIETAVDNIDWAAVNEAFGRVGDKIGQVMWEHLKATLAGNVKSFGEKIIEKLPGAEALKGGFDVLRGIGKGLQVAGVDLAPIIPVTEEFQGPVAPTPSGRAIFAPAATRPEPELRRSTTVNFNIDTFVGLNEEAAATLGEVAASEFVKELEKMGVR